MSYRWVRYRLEELGQIITGKTPPSTDQDYFSLSGIPFVTPRDMDGRRWINTTERYLSKFGVQAVKKSLVPANSIAVSCIGSDMGKAVLLKSDSVTNQQINTIIIDTKKFNPIFVYYILSTKQDALKSIAGGSATPILNKRHFGKFEIDLPTKKEQDSLVKYLECLDDKIELNTQINQTLEQIAQALFKSWFVDFDPVKAKIAVLEAGGTAEAAELAAMSTIAAKSPEQLADMQQTQPEVYQQLAQTAALFPAAMEDSKLGEIPEGWVVTKISDFGSIICGKTPSKARSDFFGRDIPFIKIPDMHTSMFVVNASEYLSKAGAESQPKKDIPKGSICISSIATVGKVIITIERSQTNQQINSIVPDKSFHTPYLYFYMVLLENHFHDLSSGGSATLNMNTSTFARVNVVKPPDDILLRFHTAVKNNLYLIEKYLLSNLTLEDTRDTLLPKLLSGAIDLAHINKSSPSNL